RPGRTGCAAAGAPGLAGTTSGGRPRRRRCALGRRPRMISDQGNFPDSRPRAAEPPPRRPPERASLYLRCPRPLTWQVPDGQTEEFAAFCRRHHIRILAWGRSYMDGPGAPAFVPVRLAPPAEWQEVQVESGRKEQTIRRLREAC